jgi:hypothetical protein
MFKNFISISVAVLVLVLLSAGYYFYVRGELGISKKISIEADEFNADNSEDITVAKGDENKSPAENDSPEEKKAGAEENVADNSQKEQTAEADNNFSKSGSIISKPVSWGYQKMSERKIDTLIIHSSYNALGGDPYSVDKLIGEYKIYKVAPHYLIDREGKVYRLVEEKNIAYHAGVSQVPDGRTDVNGFSIGIELINNEKDKYTSAQYAALKKLIGSLKARYEIKYVLGHNQISEGRKTDPWNFEWNKI